MGKTINVMPDFMIPVQTNALRVRQTVRAPARLNLRVWPALICQGASAPPVRQTRYAQAARNPFIASPDITKIKRTTVYPVRDTPVRVTRSSAVGRDIICMAVVSACGAMNNIIVLRTSVLLV